MATHEDFVAELIAQLDAHPDAPVVIENEEGEAFEIVDCTFENVADRDQVFVTIARRVQ